MASYRKSSVTSQVGKDMSLATRSAKKSEKKCGSCDNLCKDNDKALLCTVCERWFHIQCQSVGEEKYRVISADAASEVPTIHWFCNSSCNQFAAKFLEQCCENSRTSHQ